MKMNKSNFLVSVIGLLVLGIVVLVAALFYCLGSFHSVTNHLQSNAKTTIVKDVGSAGLLREVRDQLTKGGITILQQSSTPSPNLYALITNHGVFYVDPAHQLLIYGVMINLKNGKDITTKLLKQTSANLKMQFQAETHKPIIFSANHTSKTLHANTQLMQPTRNTILENKPTVSNNLLQAKTGQDKTIPTSTIADNMKGISSKLLFNYPAIGKPLGSITVFARPGCEYCHEFFTSYTKPLQKAGVSIRYIFAPMPGGIPNPDPTDLLNALASENGKAITKALCAKNKTTALNDYIMQGITPNSTITPSCRGAEFAAIKYMYQTLKVPETPFIVLSTGKIFRGIPNNPVQTITRELRL